MDIGLYISELLRDSKEIGLPGIGTLSKRRIPASYDTIKGMLNPPLEEIHLVGMDGPDLELVKYISRQKKISEASARYFIAKYADSLLQNLKQDGQAEINGLGTLSMQAGQIVMQPVKFATASFGLASVKDPVLTTTSPEKTGQAVLSEPFPVQPFVDENGSERSGRTASLLLSILFLVLIAGGLAYIFQPELFNLDTDKPIHQRKTTVNHTSVPVRAHRDSDSLSRATPPVADSNSAKTLPVTAAPAAVNQVLPKYEIVGASFNLQKEAEEYVRRLGTKGIKAAIVEDKRKPRFKVSLGSFTVYDEANAAKRKIQENFNKEAWILTINDKEK